MAGRSVDEEVLHVALADEAATLRCGAAAAPHVHPGDVLLLVGDLGLGKTTWMRGLASGLSVDPAEIRSPTFALVMEHTRSDGGGILLHADLYRAGSDEVAQLGLLDVIGASDVVAAIEWPGPLATQLRGLPVWTLHWHVGRAGADRVVAIRPPPGRSAALAAALQSMLRAAVG